MTAPKREDARIQRTYTLLLQALTDLLAEKPFDEIRVSDLCECAGIHRSTFYAHFEDKFHLLTFGVREVMDVIVASAPTANQDVYLKAVRRMFRHFSEKRQMYRLLFLDVRNGSAKDLFCQTFIRASDELLRRSFPGVSSADLMLYSRHYIGGLLAVVEDWLRTGAEIPEEEIADRFARLVPNYVAVFGN